MTRATLDLAQAVAACDVAAVRAALAAGVHPDSADPMFGTNPTNVLGPSLHPAAATEIALLLLQHGADPNRGRSQQPPPLRMCAYVGDDVAVRALLAHGARTDGAGADGNTLLHCATASGLLWLIERCLRDGMETRARNAAGVTCAHLAFDAQRWLSRAIAKDTVAVARAVQAAGGDLFDCSPLGDEGTPLHWACGHGDVAGVCFLLERGARLDARSVENGELPLHHAARLGAVDVIAPLVAAGADVNARDDAGFTALHLAAWAGSAARVAALLQAGADPTAASTAPRRLSTRDLYPASTTARDLARRQRAAAVVELLKPAPKKKKKAQATPPRTRSTS